jgi:hypothetical protein
MAAAIVAVASTAIAFSQQLKWQQDKFAISFFVQSGLPPIDDESFKLMKEGNFTAVGLFDHLHDLMPNATVNEKQLKLCEK